MKSRTKVVIRVIAAGLAAILLLVLSYLLYVILRYYRLEDHLPLSVAGEGQGMVPVGETLSLTTYNIGFGAYSRDYSFFMDGGVHSRAYSREAVLTNTAGAISVLQTKTPDFILLQEVDVKGTRSYEVDQTALFAEAFTAYDRVFAQNYDSPYFLYPFSEPIGANRSGMMTFSRYDIAESTRRRLPIEETVYQYLDLDRAYSVSVIPTENGRSLYLYNVHLSAYTSDGTIANEQLRLLSEDMAAARTQGHYVIAAGDFNKDMLGDSSQYFKRSEGEFTWAKPFDATLLPAGFTSHSGENLPTCRNADSAFRGDGTDFVLSVDGVLTSDNVEVLVCETVDANFQYSDHNPVYLSFRLMPAA